VLGWSTRRRPDLPFPTRGAYLINVARSSHVVMRSGQPIPRIVDRTKGY